MCFSGGLLTVQYEAVVEDLDAQVAQLLSHARLDFEEACLRYYEKIAVPQARAGSAPIYRDALTLWEHYQAHLAPLASVLDERGVPRCHWRQYIPLGGNQCLSWRSPYGNC